MATPVISAEYLQVAIDALNATRGRVSDAAARLGIPRTTLDARIAQAKRAGMITAADIERLRRGDPVVPPAEFEIDELPSELAPIDELLERRSKQFKRKERAKEARHLVPVRVKIDGPFGLALGGDPHLDDDGTDIDLVREHIRIIGRTEGMLAGNVGDFSNNWVGRLARLYGQQGTSAREAWALVEWYIQALPWLFLIGGNHDCWSGDGDPIQWMARSAKVSYEAHGMRLGLTCPNGRVIRLNARHDFSGKSQWNTAHGPAKAAQLGWRDHLLVCGHTHQSGYQILRDPSTGLVSHALRVGSYKTFDRYAEEKGLPNQTISACVVVVVRPDKADDDPDLITVFHGVESGADFLKWLRKRKA